MTDVFISYSRKDQQFVRMLSAALEARQRDAWVDWEGIPPTAEWLSEIRAAIDAADTFLFVISPDSLASKVCMLEIDHAAGHNKRLVPVVRRDAGGQGVHAALAKLNWIFMREHDHFEAAIDTLVEALDTDLAHVKLHTHYLKRALEWEHMSFDKSYALRGRDLAAAENWLADSGGKAPQPTSLHNRYILDSRRVATLRQRITGGAIAAGLLIATVLGLLALQQREAKHQNQQRAIANQLVGESRLALDERDDGLEDSVQLAAEAMRRLSQLGERSLAVDQALRRGLALLPPPPSISKLEVHGETRAVAFSAKGAHLALATSLGEVLVADVIEGRTVGAWTMALKPGDSLRAIAVDTTGTRVAVWRYASSTGRSRLSLWDTAGAVELTGCDRDGDFEGPRASLGPQGMLWIDRTIWRFEDCRPWPIWDDQAIVGPIALSADGLWLAASVRARGDRQRWIEIRDAQTGAETARWRHDGFVAQLWWIDGDRRLAGTDITKRSLEVWSLESTGRPREARFAEPLLAVGGDGRQVATAAQDAPAVRIRSAVSGEEAARLIHPQPVRAAAFSPDGRTLSTVVGKQLWRWELDAKRPAIELGPAASRQLEAAHGARTSGDLVQRLGLKDHTVLATAACPDQQTLAVTLGSISRAGWQARTGVWAMREARQLISFDLLDTLGFGPRGLNDRSAALLACSADGRLLAMPAGDAVVVREVSDGALVARLSHPGVHTVAFAPDGAFLATAGRGPVRIWQLSSGAEVARLLDDAPVEHVAFSDDGRHIATGAAEGTRSFLWQPQQLIAEACALLPRPLAPDTWRRLFPGAVYVDTCAAAGSMPR